MAEHFMSDTMNIILPAPRLTLRPAHCLRGVAQFLLILIFSIPFARATDWQYSVRPGDTIWSVCKTYTAYDNCWKELPSHNSINEPRSLSIGERLNLPLAWLKQAPVAAMTVYVYGDVFIGPPGNQAPLAAGSKLNIGDRIETRSGNATLRFGDGSLLSMSDETELVLDAVSAFRQSRASSVQVSLPRGSVRVRVPVKQPPNRFDVRTPSAVAAVRGTDFRVHSDAQSQVARGEVLEGSISLVNQLSDTDVNAGFGAMAEADLPVAEPVKLLHAPVWNLSCEDPGYAAWDGHPQAKNYRLVLLEDDENVDKVLTTHVIDKTNYTFTGLEEKCYQLRVNAVDALGFNGLESQRQFCYELTLDKPKIEKVVWKNGKIRGDWNTVPFAQQYRIEVSDDVGFTNTLFSQVVSRAELNRALSKMPDKVYVRVRAESGLVTSEFSEMLAVEHTSSRYWLVGVFAAVLAFALL